MFGLGSRPGSEGSGAFVPSCSRSRGACWVMARAGWAGWAGWAGRWDRGRGTASTCTYSEAHRAQLILQCKVEPCARCGNLWVHFSAWVSSKHPRCHPEQRTSAGGRGKPLSGSELFGALAHAFSPSFLHCQRRTETPALGPLPKVRVPGATPLQSCSTRIFPWV